MASWRAGNGMRVGLGDEAHGWVGQVVQESATQQFLQQRRRDQQRALQLLRDDPGLRYAL